MEGIIEFSYVEARRAGAQPGDAAVPELRPANAVVSSYFEALETDTHDYTASDFMPDIARATLHRWMVLMFDIARFSKGKAWEGDEFNPTDIVTRYVCNRDAMRQMPGVVRILTVFDI